MKNLDDRFVAKVDVELYNTMCGSSWPQGKYLVHGYDDVYWTNDLDEVMCMLRDELVKAWQEHRKKHENAK